MRKFSISLFMILALSLVAAGCNRDTETSETETADPAESMEETGEAETGDMNALDMYEDLTLADWSSTAELNNRSDEFMTLFLFFQPAADQPYDTLTYNLAECRDYCRLNFKDVAAYEEWITNDRTIEVGMDTIGGKEVFWRYDESPDLNEPRSEFIAEYQEGEFYVTVSLNEVFAVEGGMGEQEPMKELTFEIIEETLEAVK